MILSNSPQGQEASSLKQGSWFCFDPEGTSLHGPMYHNIPNIWVWCSMPLQDSQQKVEMRNTIIVVYLLHCIWWDIWPQWANFNCIWFVFVFFLYLYLYLLHCSALHWWDIWPQWANLILRVSATDAANKGEVREVAQTYHLSFLYCRV